MNPRVLLFCACIALAPSLAAAQHAGHAPPAQVQTPPADRSQVDHSQMEHSQGEHDAAPAAPQREPVPAVTEADRRAAFPEVHAHHAHGTSLHSLTVVDRLEWVNEDHAGGIDWEAGGWIGGDVRKFAWRSEGHHRDGRVERASVEALYSQGIRAWWDIVAGVRHDSGEGPARSWLALGVQGVAPYKFEVGATAYLGQGGRSALVAEAEYDTLLSNRLILQWSAEASLHGKDDPALGIGSGLSSAEAGLRLRYEIRRQFAPYVGITHEHAFGETARLRRAAGHAASGTHLVAGIRIWL